MHLWPHSCLNFLVKLGDIKWFPVTIGAIVGLIGTVISRFTDIWEKKEEAGIQLELAKRNKELAEIELKKEQIRAQSQADVANSRLACQEFYMALRREKFELKISSV